MYTGQYMYIVFTYLLVNIYLQVIIVTTVSGNEYYSNEVDNLLPRIKAACASPLLACKMPETTIITLNNPKITLYIHYKRH